ncbi:nucleotide pyrophosphohydrolase [Cellulomonas carbonis]|uniref:nucleotide pyrophosphohydrolase n=1 Tax=Cellulomonas carbonis TaxID=1386092 RepID=UPI000B238D70|nr:nucleotide pyrophosphohydrolase [Cellulomonas carbonis]GGC02319.1 nucleotide pyrophosphohydrolase [Cellulomonas carbonis]
MDDTEADPRPGDISELTKRMRDFTEERDWGRFHDPKSLALALVGEVGELAELLQWISAEDAVAHFAEPSRQARIGEELADVLLYLVRLADVLGVDLGAAAVSKLRDGATRFPPDEVRGVAPHRP